MEKQVVVKLVVEEATTKEEEMEITEGLDQVLEGEGGLELDLAVGLGQTVDNLLIRKDPKVVYQVTIGAHLEPELV